MARPLSRDASAVSTITALVGVVLAIAIILAIYYVYLVPSPAPTPLRAQEGDVVGVEYVGTFADTGLVFDTSNSTVAGDNASYLKAHSFGWRSRWDPLSFTVGDGQMIRGFDQGVRGLARGDSRTLVVPAADGYGVADPAKLTVRPLLEPVPIRVTMNESIFRQTYGVAPASGVHVTDPVWGWDAYVSVAGTIVTVTNSPNPGQTIRPYGAWDARVESILDAGDGGAGVILVRHLLTPSQVDQVGGTASGADFYLSAVDTDTGTFTLNFNRQVVGRTLVFQVTVRTLVRP